MKLKKIVIKKLLPAVIFVLVGFTTFGQKTITGTVTGNDGEAIPGVSVLVKGTTSGTMTDALGKYSLAVPNEATTLVFSYIGMKTQEKTIEGNVVNCVLSIENSELAEVVVIGYGQVKKEDATGSVQSVSSEDFNKGAITSPQELLVGKSAGVQITTGGGAPGEGATIRIRGGSSLSASNDPLIVIDGVPVDNNGVAGMRNPLNIVNPNDIETFTILKDASATAIYGSRASNGVIIITTKKSKVGNTFKINYNTVLSYSTLDGKNDVLNADEFRSVIEERFGKEDTAYALMGDANTDWQKVIFQNAFGQDHNLNFSGAYKTLPYRVSLGYSDKNGTLKTGKFSRMTGAINLNPSLLNNHLNVNINLKGMSIKNHFADQGAIGNALAFDPTQDVYNSESPYGGYFVWTGIDGSPNTLAPQNPLALLEMHSNVSNVNRVLGNVKLNYKLHFLPDLNMILNLATDRSETSGEIDNPENAPFDYDALVGGGYKGNYLENKSNDLLDFYANYNKKFDFGGKLDFMTGYSYQHLIGKGSSFGTNFIETDTVTNSDYYNENVLISFFGRMNFTLKDKYLFTFTLRRDGTSRFSPENRWGTFPSGAFAWKIKNESFLKDVSLISDLKLRLGYGITGQENIGSGNFPYLARYTYSNNFATYLMGSAYYTMLRPEGYNESLKWEETETYNVGFDFGFLKNKIIGTLDAYYRKTNGLLNVIPVSAGSNFTNEILSNVGNMENRGIEFSITDRIITKEDMTWEVSFNATYNKTLITKLTAFEDTSYQGVRVGGIEGGTGGLLQIHSVGYAPNSYFVYEQVYDADGNPIEGLYVDRNEDGIINDDDKYRYKNPTAEVYLGLSSRFSYKNLDASFSSRASIGNYVYNNVYSNRGTYNSLFHSTYFLSNVNSNVLETNFVNGQNYSDYYIENASFFKLDNFSIGYMFNKVLKDKLNIHVSATVQNVFTITKYSGLDPEVFGGIDNNIYPRPRIFMLGINMNF